MTYHDIELRYRYPELFRQRDIDTQMASERLRARPGDRIAGSVAAGLRNAVLAGLARLGFVHGIKPQEAR